MMSAPGTTTAMGGFRRETLSFQRFDCMPPVATINWSSSSHSAVIAVISPWSRDFGSPRGLQGIRHRQNKGSRNETASNTRKGKLEAIGRQGRHDVIQGGSLVRLRDPETGPRCSTLTRASSLPGSRLARRLKSRSTWNPLDQAGFETPRMYESFHTRQGALATAQRGYDQQHGVVVGKLPEKCD